MSIFSIHRLFSYTLLFSLISLTACTTVPKDSNSNTASTATPPTTTTTPTTPTKQKIPSTHTVASGETLSIIGQKYGLDYVSIAEINKIPAPYNKISVGQKLKLTGAKTITANEIKWVRPVSTHHRKLLQGQYHTVYYKGKVGDSIYAAADGYVIYASAPTSTHKNLKKKGNTIIIIHQNQYSSVYAHNSRILVTAGTYVKAGQRIAEMGETGDIDEPVLGFQIKHDNKFMNPRKLIP